MAKVIFEDDVVRRTYPSLGKSAKKVTSQLGLVMETVDNSDFDSDDTDAEDSEKVLAGTVRVSWYPSSKGFIVKESEVRLFACSCKIFFLRNFIQLCRVFLKGFFFLTIFKR